jgi:hypothetical protein
MWQGYTPLRPDQKIYIPCVKSGGMAQHHHLSSGCSSCKQMFAADMPCYFTNNAIKSHVTFPGIYNVGNDFIVIW